MLDQDDLTKALIEGQYRVDLPRVPDYATFQTRPFGAQVSHVRGRGAKPQMPPLLVADSVHDVNPDGVIADACRVVAPGAIMADELRSDGPVSGGEPPCHSVCSLLTPSAFRLLNGHRSIAVLVACPGDQPTRIGLDDARPQQFRRRLRLARLQPTRQARTRTVATPACVQAPRVGLDRTFAAQTRDRRALREYAAFVTAKQPLPIFELRWKDQEGGSTSDAHARNLARLELHRVPPVLVPCPRMFAHRGGIRVAGIIAC